MKIAIAQINPTIGNINGNTELILNAAVKAAKDGANLLITPELALCGYPPRDLLIYPDFIAKMQEALQVLATNIPQEICLLVGLVTPNLEADQQGGKSLFNSVALLGNGIVQQFFDKRLLPTYDVFDENRYFQPGAHTDYFTLNDTKIGVTICEDLWNNHEFWGKRHYPCNPWSDLAEQGVDLVVNLSASPYRMEKQKLRESMLSHGSKYYHLPLIYVNQVGGNDDLIFDGCSVAFNRQGEVLYRAASFATDLVLVNFDEEKRDIVKIINSLHPCLTPLPATQDAEVWSALVLGLKDYVAKCGFSKVVLGLSGGIDSALVAAIACAALGKDRVLGVLMPSPYSSDHSVSDALELAKNLGIEYQIIPIGNLMSEFDESLSKLFMDTPFGLAEENLQSRIRGSILMAISNKFGHLLLATGNKSEMSVGYCTLYGDMNGGLAVIADVPKTRVYSICKWLNNGGWQSVIGHQEEQTVIPENILIKPPSAELKPGQLDQDSLPPYEILDNILYALIDNCQSPEEIIELGADPQIVEQVINLVMRAEFKRRQAPPGLKISDRAFGTGWRMPIAKASFF